MVPACAPAAQAVIHAGGLQVGQVDVAVPVGGHLAGHEGGAAELGGGDHRIAGAAATGVTGLDHVALQVGQQFCLPRLVHQGHHALVDAHLREVLVLHLDLGIHQRRADAVCHVFFHGVFRPVKPARYYPGPPADLHTRFPCPAARLAPSAAGVAVDIERTRGIGKLDAPLLETPAQGQVDRLLNIHVDGVIR